MSKSFISDRAFITLTKLVDAQREQRNKKEAEKMRIFQTAQMVMDPERKSQMSDGSIILYSMPRIHPLSLLIPQ